MPLCFVKSSKNRNLLIHCGYTFVKDYEKKEKVYWKCVKCTTDKCRGRVCTYLEEIIYHREEHNHAPESIDFEVRKTLANVREKAAKCLTSSTRQVILEAIGVPSQSVAAALPSIYGKNHTTDTKT